jgi:hypothetical protein
MVGACWPCPHKIKWNPSCHVFPPAWSAIIGLHFIWRGHGRQDNTW